MARPGGRLLRLLLIVAALVAIIIIVAPFVPLDPLKPAVESRLSATLGRRVGVGSVRLSLAGGPYLIIDGMVAKEDSAFGDGNFLEADQVRANLAFLPFVLRREVVIEALDLKSPRFVFVKNPGGVWNWTTLGRARQEATGSLDAFIRSAAAHLIAASAAIESLSIESATLRLIDRSNTSSPESLYKNVRIRAGVSRSPGDQNGESSRVTGELSADSGEAEGAELLKTSMPFDLVFDRGESKDLTIRGQLGPGRLETRSLVADSFKSSLDFKESRLALDHLDLSLYEGSLAGRMGLDLRSQNFTAEGQVAHLNIDQAIGSKLGMPGQITGHIDAQFKLEGRFLRFQEAIPTVNGSGHFSSRDMFIASVNLSEQVARALKLNEIGDMGAGTGVGSLQSEFRISRGKVTTNNLSIEQLDGLGDAKSNQGWLEVNSSPALDYSATVLLTPDATARVKSSSPLIGLAVAILEQNSRVAVPVSIRGEVRNPAVHVDVSRILR
jgi:uncharacterized protein involved in outer membrane biogenesis